MNWGREPSSEWERRRREQSGAFPPMRIIVVVVVVVVEYPIIYIYIIVELYVATVARFVLFFTVFSQRTCLKPWF